MGQLGLGEVLGLWAGMGAGPYRDTSMTADGLMSQYNTDARLDRAGPYTLGAGDTVSIQWNDTGADWRFQQSYQPPLGLASIGPSWVMPYQQAASPNPAWAELEWQYRRQQQQVDKREKQQRLSEELVRKFLSDRTVDLTPPPPVKEKTYERMEVIEIEIYEG